MNDLAPGAEELDEVLLGAVVRQVPHKQLLGVTRAALLNRKTKCKKSPKKISFTLRYRKEFLPSFPILCLATINHVCSDSNTMRSYQRIRIRGSMLLDPDLDPDPALFVIDLQDANKKLFFYKVF